MERRGDVGFAPTERVGDAMSHGDWRTALELLRDIEGRRELTEEELDRLGDAAYASGELEVALTAWEQLHARRVARGDHVGAADAAAQVAMYLMMDTGLMAPVRGWASRAERLLEDHDETPVHAQLAMVRTYERLMSGDMDAARHWAERAIDVGLRQATAAPVAIARVARARLHIFDGDVEEGLRLLDEAAVATVSGELDPLAVGMVYCELVCAMQGLAQYDRAEQWTEAMDRWRRGAAFGGINGRCRVHRAEILRLRGSCDDAEEEALSACEELRPWMRREFGWPLTELGTIRLRKGDLAGAEEAFLAAHENGWDPQPGLALLRLAQHEVAEAVALIGHALDHPVNVPSKERPPHVALCRAPLLEAQVQIALAGGDGATARDAAAELGRIAEIFRSPALAASAALAQARVALSDGDLDRGVRSAESAVAGWSEVGAPYETSLARMVLAEAHRAAGREERASLEFRAAHSALTRIGARLKADEAERARGDAPSAAVTADERPTSPNVFRLEGDTRTVEFDGRAVLLRDLKGMRYLERLLTSPGREFHVMDLARLEADGGPPMGAASAADGVAWSSDDDAGPVIDEQAKEAYRRRLAEIDEDLDAAARTGDTERAAMAQADRDYLVRELARAYGLGGRSRLAGSDSERARASVSRALRYALTRIAEHHPSLADHLAQTVRTGTYCAYVPDPRVPTAWQT